MNATLDAGAPSVAQRTATCIGWSLGSFTLTAIMWLAEWHGSLIRPSEHYILVAISIGLLHGAPVAMSFRALRARALPGVAAASMLTAITLTVALVVALWPWR